MNVVRSWGYSCRMVTNVRCGEASSNAKAFLQLVGIFCNYLSFGKKFVNFGLMSINSSFRLRDHLMIKLV